MPRPRKHDERTRAAMLDAAERCLVAEGPQGLSVRSVAEDVGTTTWAVYSLFGSRDGLLTAVAARGIGVLEEGLRTWPATDDPLEDLIDLGARMYRGFVVDHPWLFRLAFQRILPDLELGPLFFEVRARTWELLEARVKRLDERGLLAGRTVRDATVEFNAMCEGLANAELRGGTLAPGNQERIWRDAFTVVVHGLTTPAVRRPARGRRRVRSATPR